MTTSPVASFEGSCARTASGIIYALGRRLSRPEDLSDADAQAAFRALVLQTSDGAERDWLAACKMARHLRIPLPSPSDASDFIERRRGAYAQRKLHHSGFGSA